MFVSAVLCLFGTFLDGGRGNKPLTVELNNNSLGGIFVVECGVVRYIRRNCWSSCFDNLFSTAVVVRCLPLKWTH